MKFIITCFFACISVINLFSQDTKALIKEADRLEAIPNEIAAFLKFKEVVTKEPGNIYALSKCSELCCRIGKRQTDPKAKEDFYIAAKSFAEAAIKVDPTNSDANCAMAMALGHISMTKTNKEKIASARDLRKYVDLAIKANPNNFRAWHVLGRWHYEISNLSMFEKAAVKLLYGGMPAASLKSSIACFEKAKSLTGPGFVINYYELARAYYRDNQKTKAINTIKVMLTLPNNTEADAGIKEEGKKLLLDWQ